MGLYSLVWTNHSGLRRWMRSLEKGDPSSQTDRNQNKVAGGEVRGLWLKWIYVDKECSPLCVLLGPKSLLIYCLGDILKCTHNRGCFHWSADGLVRVPGSRGSSCYLRLNRRKGKRTLEWSDGLPSQFSGVSLHIAKILLDLPAGKKHVPHLV